MSDSSTSGSGFFSSSWFRSEPMEYISVVMNEDAAYECLIDVGKLGAIQFTDLNSDLTPFKRRYVSYVKRCGELERKLRFLSQEVESLGIRNDNAAATTTTTSVESTSDHPPQREQKHTSNDVADDIISDNGIMLSTTNTNTPRRTNISLSAVASISISSEDPLLEEAESSRGDGIKSATAVHDVDDLTPILQRHVSHIEELNVAYQILAREYNHKIEYQAVLETLRRLFFAVAGSSSSHGGSRNVSRHGSGGGGNDTESQVELASIMTGGGTTNSSLGGDDIISLDDNDMSAPLLENQYEIGTDKHPDIVSSSCNVSGESNQQQQPQFSLDHRIRFSSITGVVDTSERVRLERMIFRATRGNTYIRFFPVSQTLLDTSTNTSSGTTNLSASERQKLLKKSVFIIFFRSELIELKLIKICDAFGATRYDIPNSIQQHDTEFGSNSSNSPLENLNNLLEDVSSDIRDCKIVLNRNFDSKYKLCQQLAMHVEKWKYIVLQEKAVYHTMNKFKKIESFCYDAIPSSSSFGVGSGNVTLRGEGWALSKHVQHIRRVIDTAHNQHSRRPHPHHESNRQSSVIGDRNGLITTGSASDTPETADSAATSYTTLDDTTPTNSLVSQLPRSSWPEIIPTHFETNGFTYGYQEFVNTYGIPRYREVNPAAFTAVTFPFLFGIMYGDVGHGLILFLFGCYQIIVHRLNDSKNATDNNNISSNNSANIGDTPSKKKKSNEIAQFLSDARYMITMMGFFAIYAGFIYNDCFAHSLNIFGTKWTFQGHGGEQGHNDVDVKKGTIASLRSNYTYGTSDSVYPLGFDPVWSISENELDFINSFKMKFSVIVGIIQMILGLLLKACNAIYFNNQLDLRYMFLPMIVFTCCLFVYMVLLIVVKWSIGWDTRMLLATCFDPNNDPTWNTSLYDDWKRCDQSIGDGTCTPWGYSCSANDTTAVKCPFDYGGSGDGCQPPNLVNTLILMVLQPGTVDEPMFPGQHWLQVLLVFIAFLSIPTLLCMKPWILWNQRQQQRRQQEQSRSMTAPLVQSIEGSSTSNRSNQQVQSRSGSLGNDHDDDEDFNDILIHQGIETIEFILGMISNTASYLRLWALSLAHFELAKVLWDLTLKPALNKGGAFHVYLGFGIYFIFTIGILLFMDALECFLHALRLHWVEFQNKFFHGDGTRFVPYSLQQILLEESLLET